MAMTAKRAALLYAQMVDGFWMDWLLDRNAYSLEDATGTVSEWVLGLFNETDGRRRSSAASETNKPVAGRTRPSAVTQGSKRKPEKEKVSAACSGMIFLPAIVS